MEKRGENSVLGDAKLNRFMEGGWVLKTEGLNKEG